MKIHVYKNQVLGLFIFLVLLIVGLILYIITIKNSELDRISTLLFADRFTIASTKLVHDLQLERGLSVGYLSRATPDSTVRARLEKRFPRTDATWDRVMTDFIDGTSRPRQQLKAQIGARNTPHVLVLRKLHDQLPHMRNKILQRTISYQEALGYYRRINREMLSIMYALPTDDLEEGIVVYQLAQIKEYAGLERAYVYHQLLAGTESPSVDTRIDDVIDRQAALTRKLLFNHEQSDDMRRIAAVTKSLTYYRQLYRQHLLRLADAETWFQTSTRRIEFLETVILRTLQQRHQHLAKAQQKAHNILIGVMILGGMVLVLLLTLLGVLSRLIRHQMHLMEKLRIGSYVFESQEAMVIANQDGNIMDVNRAFETITGYTKSEVIGRNPSLLKSHQHDAAFYHDMWTQILSQGAWKGEIYNQRKNGEVYCELLSITAIKDPQGTVTHYVSNFTDLTELKAAEEQAHYQATHDMLTDLPNRRTMVQKLEIERTRAIRHRAYDAFLFVDIDDFKRVNDHYGHTVGDKLLQAISHRLTHTDTGRHFAARISGDEFCVLLVDVGTDALEATEATRRITQSLLSEIAMPYTIGVRDLRIGVSIGVRLFPEGEHTIEEIISDADTAMYEAKAKGKNQLAFFDREIQQKIADKMQMEKELRLGIERHELLCFYQPKVEVATGRIWGAELLVRWHHPERGLLYPGGFLDALESAALMPELSCLTLGQACAFVRQYGEMFEGPLSLNITVEELQSDRFVDRVYAIIAEYGIDPQRIELEILENDLIEDFDAVIAHMNALKAFGVQFSIDDFGVGYSSINYLHTLPVNTIKIDRAFAISLDEHRTQELVNVIVNLAKVFRYKVVLEGIEEPYQLEYAKTHGIDMYQGFLFSEAVDETTFLNLLRETHSCV